MISVSHDSTLLGLDAHKLTISAAVLPSGADVPVVDKISSDPDAVRRLVGRFDPKLDRQSGTLQIRGLCWEPTVRDSRPRARAFETAIARLGKTLGAETWSIE